MGDLFAGLCLWPRHDRRVYVYYLKHFAPDVEIISDAWPKLFQPDYTEVVTKILQAKPQAMYSALWGGDLDILHRPGQHLRDVQPDGGVRRQHGGLHGA